MKYKLAIFDLDGTLMNTSPGIFASANHAMVELGLPPEDDIKQLSKFIGPPIYQCFRNTYNLDESLIDKAVEAYRKEYFARGQYNAVIYPQLEETLSQLQDHGCLLAVGTLKHEDLATNMMHYFKLEKYFSSIRGADTESKLSKADIVRKVLEDLHIQNSEALLIGDTIHDLEGAKGAGVGFIAVDYGFGFPVGQKQEEGMLAVIKHPLELLSYFV